MASRLANTFSLLEALKAEGHDLPADCQSVELVMPSQGIIQLLYTCAIDRELLGKIGRALERMAQE